jgi:hypothetical protein
VREGRVLSVVLPTQIENLIPEAPAPVEISLEDIAFIAKELLMKTHMFSNMFYLVPEVTTVTAI